MTQRVRIPNGFEPREYQRRPMAWFDSGGKFAFSVWHRRGGKDLTAAHYGCKAAHQRKGLYWHIFPTMEQGRKAIWEGFTKDGQRIMERVFPTAIRKSPREWHPKAEMVVELKCGSIWRLQGSDKMEVVGAGPVGVVFSEFALSKPKTWDLVRPMLRENGGWAWFITTPRGNNHAKKLYDRVRNDSAWHCDTQTLFDTRAYDPEATIAEERASGMPEALIRQEYLCDWSAANVGSVWGDLLEALEQRGGLAEFDHSREGVFTSWDLGFSDSTAIWFWQVRSDGGVDVVDHYESHGQPLSHYFDVLEARGYRYRKHWLPHDAKARTLASGTSILEQCQGKWGAGAVALGPPLSLLDGIQAARWLLQQAVRIHPRCAEGLDALRAYRYEYDEDRKTFSVRPVHDWASHTADAFRYLATERKVTADLERKPEPKPPGPLAVPAHNTFRLDDLWDTAPRARR